MNFWDYLLLAALLVACFFAALAVKKHGPYGCGGDCSRCAFHQSCSKKRRPPLKKPKKK